MQPVVTAKNNSELMTKKLQNVDGLRDSRGESGGRFDNQWHTVTRKGPDLRNGGKAAT